MISILKATVNDVETIVQMGNIAVGETHRDSSPAEAMSAYLEKNYSSDAIRKELSNEKNVYHIIYVNGAPAGFSKIIFNEGHLNIDKKDVTKLDRIYLLKEFFDLKPGYELLQFNIELAKRNTQSGIWLFTWVENKRAINFYLRNGFSITGTHQFQVTETHFNENHQMLLNFIKA